MKKQNEAAKNLVWSISKSSLSNKIKIDVTKVSIRTNLKFSR